MANGAEGPPAKKQRPRTSRTEDRQDALAKKSQDVPEEDPERSESSATDAGDAEKEKQKFKVGECAVVDQLMADMNDVSLEMGFKITNAEYDDAHGCWLYESTVNNKQGKARERWAPGFCLTKPKYAVLQKVKIGTASDGTKTGLVISYQVDHYNRLRYNVLWDGPGHLAGELEQADDQPA